MNNTTTSNKIQEATWSDLFSKDNALKAVILALGVMLHATNVYLATTIMPSIVKEIGGLEYYAWNTTLFVVASVIGSVLSANQMASHGPKRAYQIGIVIFSIGTVICTFAPSMPILLVGRFIQGFGGGLLFALSYAMIRLVFTENLWSRAMALVSGMWGISAFSGPFIGGVFAEHAHWRWAFAFLLFFCLFIFVTASIVLPKHRNSDGVQAPPYLKLLLLILAVLAVSIGSVQKSGAENVLGVLVALLFLVLLILTEKRYNPRLLPSGAYTISSALGSTYAVMVLLTIATSIEIYVPYFAQVVNGFSPLGAGYLTVLIAFGWTLSSITFSGYKGNSVNKIIILGASLMFLGLLGLAYITATGSQASTLTIFFTGLFLLAIGAGIGMGWPHLLTRVFSLAPTGQENMTSASVTTVQLIATSFGASLAGLVTNLSGIADSSKQLGAINASIVLYGSFAIAPLLALLILILTLRQIKRKTTATPH
ncbi:MFS transporter [Sphingobacterium tabacisoli]|uniref:MFS transporter n=1 Tax=Sphingobacterium tabacisoli TaxID=2044855 RepID=A0ABW5L2S4_9SPHI|nr:MFS transporter [Sphingobacterium tabacisoli]